MSDIPSLQPGMCRSRKAPDLSMADLAARLGFEIGQILRTLVIRAASEHGRYVLVLTPCGTRIDLQRLQRQLRTGQVRMADPDEAREVTGYEPGAISPLGSGPWPVVIDASALMYERVGIASGVRGMEMVTAPAELVAVLDAQVAAIAVPAS